MKKITIYTLLLSMIFMNCSPKQGEKVMADKAKETTSKVTEPWRAKAPGAAPARSIEIGDYASFDLDNGLKVIVVENHKLPRVSYQLSLINDPVKEGAEAGVQSMAGDLLGRGTQKRSKADIDEAIDFIGASFNTSRNGMYGSSLKKHSPALLDVFTDVLYNATFPKEEFDKIVNQSRSALASDKTDPQSMVSNVSAVVNFGKDHPYGEIESEEKLDNIKLATAKKYVNTYFRPNNAYLIIVGDITPMEAEKQAKQYFGNWKKGLIPPSSYDTPNGPDARRVIVANKDGAVQSVIRVTYPVDLKPGSDDILKAKVMNSLLGGGMFSGRLMQNLREDKAYTYGARSSLNSDELIGSFRAYASVRNEVTDSSVQEFLYEMDRLVTEPVTKDELDLIKNSLSGSFARSLESPQTIARFAYNTFKYDLPKDYYNTYLQRLEGVNIADIQAMAKKYIRPENANIVVVGSADDISEGLKRFDGDGVIEYYDAFGEKVDRSKMAVSSDVTAGDIVAHYLKALGGKDKIMGVKALKSVFGMNIMGQESTTEMYQTGDKFAMKVMMAGNVVQEQKFDGMKGYAGGMGGSKMLTSEEELEGLKQQATIFEELNFMSDGYKLAVKGMDEVDGKEAYKVEVENPSGDKTYRFYGKDSGLLLRTSATQEGPQGPQEIISDYKDYKAVDGIMFPHTLSVSGAMPFPLEMKAQSYEVNGLLPADIFMIK